MERQRAWPFAAWSYSTMGFTCPLQWKLQFLDGAPFLWSEGILRGWLVHDMIDRYAQLCWQDRLSVSVEHIEKAANLHDDPAARKLFLRFAAGWSWHPTLSCFPGKRGQMGTEVNLSAPLPEELPFHGHLDYLHYEPATKKREVRIYDFKSGCGAATLDPPAQLMCYAFLAASRFPKVQSFHLQTEYLSQIEQPPAHQVSRAQALNYGEYLSEQASLIRRTLQQDNFEARPGEVCATCQLSHACPEISGTNFKNHYTLSGALRSPKDLCLWLITQEKELRLARRALKRHVMVNGPVIYDEEQGSNYHINETGRLCRQKSTDLPEEEFDDNGESFVAPSAGSR